MSEKSVKRWSAKRKQEVVLRLLPARREPGRAEPGDGAAGLGVVPVAGRVPGGWSGSLKRLTDDPKVAVLEQELKRAKRLVGDLMMDKELLEMRIARFEGEPPFPQRRSRP